MFLQIFYTHFLGGLSAAPRRPLDRPRRPHGGPRRPLDGPRRPLGDPSAAPRRLSRRPWAASRRSSATPSRLSLCLTRKHPPPPFAIHRNASTIRNASNADVVAQSSVGVQAQRSAFAVSFSRIRCYQFTRRPLGLAKMFVAIAFAWFCPGSDSTSRMVRY